MLLFGLTVAYLLTKYNATCYIYTLIEHMSNATWDLPIRIIEYQLAIIAKNLRTIPEHITNIFAEGELIENTVVRDYRITATDGKIYGTKHYNLDVVISVGYRVRSKQGTAFRQWATKVLKDH